MYLTAPLRDSSNSAACLYYYGKFNRDDVVTHSRNGIGFHSMAPVGHSIMLSPNILIRDAVCACQSPI